MRNVLQIIAASWSSACWDCSDLPPFSECGAVDFTQRCTVASFTSLFGNWNSVFKRFSRWCRHDVWKSLHAGCSQYPDVQQVLLDSTITRAHACAAGAAGSSSEAEALGRSKGGFSTKIHAITDALGNPLDFILTPEQASDIGQAENLLALAPEGTKALLADKGYDSSLYSETWQQEALSQLF